MGYGQDPYGVGPYGGTTVTPSPLPTRRINWDEPGKRIFEAGIDRGVLYVPGEAGVPWNGIVSVEESTSATSGGPRYYDGQKYQNLSLDREFTAKLEAFSSPYEFDSCDGQSESRNGLFSSQQPRKPFGLSYRSKIGNDIQNLDYGYKIHIIYNAIAVPSGVRYGTLGSQTDPIKFSWDISTTPIRLPNVLAPTSHVVIDTSRAYIWAIEAVERILYGYGDEEARLPTAAELDQLFEDNSILKIIDNGDGSWDAIGPDDVIKLIDSDTFEINWPSAVYIDSESYTIESL